MRRTLVTALLLSVGSTAWAAPDLVTSIAAPAGTHVYDTGRYFVSVTNLGPHTASSSTLTIQLPTTHTSPQVYVMGALGAKSSNCSQSGTRLVCSIGQLKKNKTATVYFDIALPWSAAPLTVTSTASTAGETNTGNNGDSDDAALVYEDLPIAGPVDVVNEHCTGTGLTAFYECTLFPSSLSSHDAVFHDDGTITFPTEPAFSGAWWQDADDHLAFEYYEGTDVVAEFEGNGVDAACFEGLTTFPGSTYVSPYSVCLQ